MRPKTNTKSPKEKFLAGKRLELLLVLAIFAIALLSNAQFFGVKLMEYDAVVKLVTHSAKTPLIDIFTQPDHAYITGYSAYRPVVALVWWGVSSFAGMDFAPYQWLNLLLNAINSVLVFFLAKKLLSDKKGIFSFFTALVFALHPLGVNAVLYVSRLPDLAVAFFSILALYSFLKYLEEKKVLFFWLSFLFCALGVFSKEIGGMIPALLFFAALFFSKEKNLKKSLAKSAKLIAPFFALIALYAAAMFSVLGRLSVGVFSTRMPEGLVIFDFFRFLFYPLDFLKTNIVVSSEILFLNPLVNVLAVLFFIACFILFAWFVLRKQKSAGLLIFAWFFLFAFLFAVYGGINSWYLYPALVPLSLIFALALKNWSKNLSAALPSKKFFLRFAGIIIIGLIALSFVAFSGLFFNYPAPLAASEINQNFLKSAVKSAEGLPANSKIILINYPEYFKTNQYSIDSSIQMSDDASVKALLDYYYPDKNFGVSALIAAYPKSRVFELGFSRLSECVYIARAFDESRASIWSAQPQLFNADENDSVVSIIQVQNSQSSVARSGGLQDLNKVQSLVITFPRIDRSSSVIFAFDGNSINKVFFDGTCQAQSN